MYSVGYYPDLVVCRVARDQKRVARRIRRFRQLLSGRDIGTDRFFGYIDSRSGA